MTPTEDATHYPSTPASNARRLSSSEDIPVSANIRVGCEPDALSSFMRFDSISRIRAVAPTPSKIGIDRSNSTTLQQGRSESARHVRERENIDALKMTASLESLDPLQTVHGLPIIIALRGR